MRFRCLLSIAAALLAGALAVPAAEPADGANPKSKAKDDKTPAGVSATDSPETVRKRLVVAPGLKVDLWAAEPLIQDVVNFSFDEQGRAYVVETGRRRTSVFDIRSYRDWVDADLSFRTPWDRAEFLKQNVSQDNAAFMRQMGSAKQGGFADFNKDGRLDWRDLEVESERIKLVWDSTGSGVADKSAVFADGFNSSISGVAAGVLARRGEVYFTSIPDVWRITNFDLRFTNGSPSLPLPFTPHAVNRKSQIVNHATGFGVHIAYGGHDMHGLKFGPDGKLYWTIADRGAALTNLSRTLNPDLDYLLKFLPDTGAVFRSNPDGSELEVVAIGLRNPQELAFDDFGNLFTADNNADGGDKARWVHIVEGADYGWRYGWQHLTKLGAWNSEMLWGLAPSNTALSYPPPVAHIGHGPAGIAHYPGAGLPDTFRDCFFYADFPGGIRYFRLEPSGASFKVANAGKWLESNSPDEREGKLLWNLYPTDIEFGPDGGAYVLDWVAGWEKTGKGRIWRVHDPAVDGAAEVREVKRLLMEGMAKRTQVELASLLGHQDQRVRMEVQYELAERGDASFPALSRVALVSNKRLARLHAIWALEQLGRLSSCKLGGEFELLTPLLRDSDDEVIAAALGLFASLDVVRVISAEFPRLTQKATPRVLAALMMAYAKVFKRISSSEQVWHPRYSIPLDLTYAARALSFALGREVESQDGRRVASANDSNSSGLVAVVTPGNLEFRVEPTPSERSLLLNQSDPIVRQSAVSMVVAGISCSKILWDFWEPDYRNELASTNAEVRLVMVLALRRLLDPAIAQFLDDPDPRIVLEAARAIADLPIEPALPKLAALLDPSRRRREESLTNPPDPKRQTPDANQSLLTSSPTEGFVLRRAINAHFRLGQPTNALALAAFAARSDAPEALRVEALEMLADWPQPSSRDKITGLWRPLAPREIKPAAEALRPHLASLLGTAPANVGRASSSPPATSADSASEKASKMLALRSPAVALAAIAAVEKLALTDSAPALSALVADTKQLAEVRTAALRCIHHSSFIAHNSALAAAALKVALTDAAESLRKEASRLSAAGGGADAIARLAATLQTGTLGERQSALQSLAGLKGKEADDALRKSLTQLLEGRLAKELHLDLLEAAAKRTSPSIKERLAQFEAKRDTKDPLAKWRECLTGGDAKAGRILFHERQEAACARCHKLAGEGGDVGPDIAGLVAKRGREYVLESIVLPNRVIAPGFESLLVVMKNGQSFAGLVKGEIGDELTLNSPEDGLLKLRKSDIARRTPALSPMPESLIEVLTKREIRDLVEFLATAK